MKNKKKILLLVLLLIIGFASVSTTLVINGIIGITKNNTDFNIIFTNAKLDGVEKKEFIDSETKQTINYETEKLTKINETTTLEYDVSNTSRIYDAEVSIVCNIVDNEGNTTTSEYIEMSYTPESMTVHAGETKSGNIITKLIKGSTEDQSVKVKCTLNANAIERDSLGEEYKEPGTYELIDDLDSDGVADIGDEIAIGEEHFYVISNSEGIINALAKYNLKVGYIYTSGGSLESTILTSEKGYGIQNAQMRGYISGEKAYGTVEFSNQNGWTTGTIIDIKNDSYANGPVKDILYGENGYENYIKKTIPTATARLITKSELEGLGCSYSKSTCKLASVPSWVYSTSYWTQSANSRFSDYVYTIFLNGTFGGYSYVNKSLCGVRPVITIPSKDKKPNISFSQGYELIGDTDTNNNEVADVGEEITIGEERFYVISQTDTEIKALAKYNLNVGSNKNPKVIEGIQHKTVRGWVSSDSELIKYGNVAFSNEKGWEKGSNVDIKQYEGAAKEALYGTNGYEKHIQKTISNASVRLITKGEIETLLNEGKVLSNGSIKEKADAKGYSWLYSTSFWTRFADSNNADYVWYVKIDGYFYNNKYDVDGMYGVRPVVTIPLNNSN